MLAKAGVVVGLTTPRLPFYPENQSCSGSPRCIRRVLPVLGGFPIEHIVGYMNVLNGKTHIDYLVESLLQGGHVKSHKGVVHHVIEEVMTKPKRKPQNDLFVSIATLCLNVVLVMFPLQTLIALKLFISTHK